MMHRFVLLTVAGAALTTTVGCRSGKTRFPGQPPREPRPLVDPDGGGEPQTTYHKDVAPLLAARCTACHADGDVAFPLTSFQDVHDRRSAVIEAVTSRRMPVWLAASGHQTYRDDPSLTDAELAVFERWRDEGYPEGDPATQPGPAGAPIFTDLRADLVLPVLPEGAQFYPDPGVKDDYHCFLVDMPLDRVRYLTGFQAVPGNRAVVHHLVVYQAEEAVVPMLHALDDEEDGLGYQCFGGAMPDRLADPQVFARMKAEFPEAIKLVAGGRDGDGPGHWLSHWAPGMKGNELPAGTGLRLKPRGVFVVQLHIYTKTAPNTPVEGVAMKLKLADEVEKPGFVIPLSKDDWLDPEHPTLVVPKRGEASFSYAMPMELLLKWGSREAGIASVDDVKQMELHTLNLHMHSYGTSAESFLEHADGSRETLLAIDRWDLRWQRDFTLVEPKVFTAENAKDTALGVRCTYGNPTDRDVIGGLGSDDEMCFDFSFIAFEKKAKR